MLGDLEVSMRKNFYLKNLDCANCASRLEVAIQKLNGVKDVTVNFFTQMMRLELNDDYNDEILNELKRVCAKIEPDVVIIEK